MKTIVLGNSIVRELNDPSTQTISVSGANWVRLLQYISSNLSVFRDSITYIHIGPVRFTIIDEDRQCVPIESPYGNPQEILRPWRRMLQANNIVVILCTIYPVCLNTYNNNSTTKCKRDTELIRSLVVVENQRIVNLNMLGGYATPYMHKRVFTRRHYSYAFRSRFLRDGLHPSSLVSEDWKKEIRRVNRINSRKVARK